LHLKKISEYDIRLFSSDFGYSTHPNDDYRKRKDLLEKMLKLPEGTRITLSWHQCRPDIQEPCTFNTGIANTSFDDKEWTQLLTWNSPLNKQWQKQMQILGEFLQKLAQAKKEIYLRPYHEMNLPSFWWADIKNPSHSIQLYKMFQRHLISDYKLTNIKWVWSISFHPKYLEKLSQYYPGDEFVDVLGVDIYPPQKNTAPDFDKAWMILEAISKNKPKALTEVSRLPTEADLKKHPWLYVVPWGENMLRKENSEEEIKKFFSNRE